MSEVRVDKISPRTDSYISVDALSHKNLIINGDMSIAQRGTSQASVTSSGYYTCDRWRLTTTLGAFTLSQSTDVPSGQGFANSFKMDCTTAEATTTAVDNVAFLSQRIEGQNLQYLKKGTANAESTTCSFWVKSNKTGTYIVEMYDTDNNRTISKSYTIDNASTWEKKIITFAGDTTGAYANDNDGSLRFNFWLGAGTNFTSGTLNTSWNSSTNSNRAVGQVNIADSTSNEWYITGVQLEANTVASSFNFEPYDINLYRCLRYFQVVGDTVTGSTAFGNGFIGNYNTTTQVIGNRQLPVRMRASPTVTFSALSTFDLEPFDVAPTTIATQNTSPNEVVLKGTDPSARTKGFACTITIDTTGGFVKMDAEL